MAQNKFTISFIWTKSHATVNKILLSEIEMLGKTKNYRKQEKEFKFS